MQTMAGMAIVGGGLAGLAAAHALACFGIQAEVFEAAPALGEIGAAVNVAPNATRALVAIGLGEKIAAVATAAMFRARCRLAVAPDIPSVDEAGLPGLYFSLWAGLFAPRGTPNHIIGTLNSAAVSTLGDAALRQKLAGQGFEIPPREQQTPGGARRLSESGDREMVADHQGGRHQGGIIPTVVDADSPPSLPGLTRQSIALTNRSLFRWMRGSSLVKPAHDDQDNDGWISSRRRPVGERTR
jgi:glycine/D-amino acid oxidase-like deaminating enzyme